jgi:hypothetical protein
MNPLNTQQILEKARTHQPIYYRWFKPEIERHPETAWQVWQHATVTGFTVIERPKSMRKKHGDFFISIDRFGFNSNYPIEQGLEIDGYGFVYFFNDAKEADVFVEERKQKFARECTALVGAVRESLGPNVQIL